MWDENRPRRQVPVHELLKRIKDMYEISAVTFPYVAQAYMFRTMFLRSGMLDVLMGKASSISALDEPALKAAEQEITEKAEKMFAPYMAFVNSHT
jgi:spore maturation protein SpmB